MDMVIFRRLSYFRYVFISLKCFGLFKALYYILKYYKTVLFSCSDIKIIKRKVLLNAIRDDVQTIIQKYKKINSKTLKPFNNDSFIFICWLQGEENMPLVVKQCYLQLLKNKGAYNVVLITERNLNKYVSIPKNILRKLHSGIISYTHFSDILRCALLSKHGGLWIDSTYWITKPIKLQNISFYTLKQIDHTDSYLSKSRWSGNCIGAGNSYYIFSFLYDCLIHYNSRYDKLVDYYLLDYYIAIAYNEFDDFALIIDSLPCRCPNIAIMQELFNHEYQSDELLELVKGNEMFKLTYKKEFHEEINGEKTFFYYFKNLK